MAQSGRCTIVKGIVLESDGLAYFCCSFSGLSGWPVGSGLSLLFGLSRMGDWIISDAIFDASILLEVTPVFPNQGALEGFLQFGLRNRIGWAGGNRFPQATFGGSPGVFECSPMKILQNTESAIEGFAAPQTLLLPWGGKAPPDPLASTAREHEPCRT